MTTTEKGNAMTTIIRQSAAKGFFALALIVLLMPNIVMFCAIALAAMGQMRITGPVAAMFPAMSATYIIPVAMLLLVCAMISTITARVKSSQKVKPALGRLDEASALICLSQAMMDGFTLTVGRLIMMGQAAIIPAMITIVSAAPFFITPLALYSLFRKRGDNEYPAPVSGKETAIGLFLLVVAHIMPFLGLLTYINAEKLPMYQMAGLALGTGLVALFEVTRRKSTKIRK